MSTGRSVGAPSAPREVVGYAIPMRVRFRGVDVRSGLLFEGPAGWAEFSPFWDYADADCVPWLAAANEAAYDGWPAPRREEIPVNATVPAVDPERARALVAGTDCETVKVKVAESGQEAADDVARVAAVREALGAGGRIRVDANGGWDVPIARTMVERLDRAAGGLEYAEQPCPTVEELAELRRTPGFEVPIAADESIRRAADPYRVAELAAADVAVLKVQPIGGVRACLEIAERIGLPVVVSSALETSVGLAAGVALAAALPELPYACGLGTGALLTDDVVAEPLRAENGRLPVRRPAVDPDALRRVAADPALAKSWRDRLSRVAEPTGAEVRR